MLSRAQLHNLELYLDAASLAAGSACGTRRAFEALSCQYRLTGLFKRFGLHRLTIFTFHLSSIFPDEIGERSTIAGVIRQVKPEYDKEEAIRIKRVSYCIPM